MFDCLRVFNGFNHAHDQRGSTRIYDPGSFLLPHTVGGGLGREGGYLQAIFQRGVGPIAFTWPRRKTREEGGGDGLLSTSDLAKQVEEETDLIIRRRTSLVGGAGLQLSHGFYNTI